MRRQLQWCSYIPRPPPSFPPNRRLIPYTINTAAVFKPRSVNDSRHDIAAEGDICYTAPFPGLRPSDARRHTELNYKGGGLGGGGSRGWERPREESRRGSSHRGTKVVLLVLL